MARPKIVDTENSRRSAERLKEIRESSGLQRKDFAEQFNINPTTYTRYESGKISQMPIQTIEDICNRFNLNYSWLLGFENVNKYFDAEKANKPTKSIQVLGTIAAGMPIFAQPDIIGYENVYADENIDFCLLVKGDSMINARIYSGDIVYVRCQPDVENGEIAAVQIDGEEATLKRVYKHEGVIILKSENPQYKDMVFTTADHKEIKILGKAVALKGKLF